MVYFSSLRTLKQGFYLKEDEIVYNDGEKETVIVNIHDLKLLGRHNHENVMAAVAISMNMGVPLEKIQKVIKEFKAVEHRIEFVTERFGSNTTTIPREPTRMQRCRRSRRCRDRPY